MFGLLYELRLMLEREVSSYSSKRPRKERRRGKEMPLQATERRNVVKGVARRVVIVKAPDPRIFEEAIFIVSEEFLNGGGISSDELLREANLAAGGYVESVLGRPTMPGEVRWLRPAVYATAGAVASALIWLTLRVFAG